MKNKLNISAPINNLGYGVFSVETILSMEQEGIEPCLFPIHNSIDVPKHQYEQLLPALKRQSYFYPDGNSLRIWHQNDMAQHIGKGVKAGYTFFEVDKLNELEKHHLNSLDCVFVSSEFYKNVCLDNNVKNVHVANPGVNTEVFNNKVKPMLDFGDKTVFLNVGKWEIRKGHDILVDAFNKAFTEKDNVLLIMCCFNPLVFPNFNGPQESKKWEKLYKSSKLGLIDKIMVVQERLHSQLELASLMNSVDYGVFPSRAEGWNLDAAEMLACDKQVILTDYSAHQEFLPYSNSEHLKINTPSREKAYDGVFFNGYGDWAKIGEEEIDQLVNNLRLCHQKKQNGIVTKVGNRFTDRFSWKNTANQIIEGIGGYE